MVFVIRHVVMTAQHPYSVAISFPCRNNFDKNQANFLESTQNPRIFASVKVHTLIVFLLHICFSYWLFGFVCNELAYGVR